ncbi:MAG TPA: hypothetical protein VGF79_10525 [Bacteroidia bacterium]
MVKHFNPNDEKDCTYNSMGELMNTIFGDLPVDDSKRPTCIYFFKRTNGFLNFTKSSKQLK